jgi:hypothetical protein
VRQGYVLSAFDTTFDLKLGERLSLDTSAGQLQVSKQLKMAPGRKIQFPTREEWKHHKDEIVRLYVKEDMRLDEVRQQMEREYNFRAKYA